MTDPEEVARRERYDNRTAFQLLQDRRLIPPSAAPATAVRAAWNPITQFIEEGPDVGERDVPESEKGQRVN